MKKLTIDEIVVKAIPIHGKKFTYSNLIYKNGISYITVRCPIHGVFNQRVNAHLNGSGCSRCNESKGELSIINFLLKHNIIFIRQKRFNDCRNILPLPFDFYLPDYNICIEYDGELHYKSVKMFGGENALLNTQNKDKIKTNYCDANNIILLRIKYDEIIEDKLKYLFDKISVII